MKWLKEESLDDSDEMPEPEELATDAISELESALLGLNAILVLLETGSETMKPDPALSSI